MKKPAFVSPGDDSKPIAHVFSTRLVIRGWTWLPLVQLAAWPVMAYLAKQRRPERTWARSLGVGALTMPVMLGSEWGHNLAHAAAAHFIRKPVDAVRVLWGLPLLVYYDVNDETVTPRQHIIRALGGPVFNALLLPLIIAFRKRTHPESAARDVADVALGTNLFISTVGMLPITFLDGGPVLKWSLVERGRTVEEADQAVRNANGVMGAAFSAATVFAFKKRRRFLGAVLAQFAAMTIMLARGWFRE